MDLNRKWVVLNPKVRNVSLIDMGKSKIFILYPLEDYVIELKMHSITRKKTIHRTIYL